MRRNSLLVLGFALFLLAQGKGFCADKIGTVDLTKLFNDYPKTKEYEKALDEKQQAYEKERGNKVEEIKKIQDKMKLLDDKQKEQQKGDLETKIKSLQQFDQEKGMDLRKERDEKGFEILKDIEKTIADYAQKEGYSMILNDKVLLYQDKNYDVTDAIYKALEQSAKQPKPAAKK